MASNSPHSGMRGRDDIVSEMNGRPDTAGASEDTDPVAVNWLFDPQSILVITCGRAGSIAVYWLLTAFCVSVTVNRYIATESPLPRYADHLAGVALMLIAIPIVIVIYMRSDKTILKDETSAHQTSVHATTHSGNKVFSTIRENLVLIGLIPFWFVSTGLDLTYIVASGTCMAFWQQCGQEIFESRVLVMVSHGLRVIGMAATTLLCVYFHKAVFQRCAFVVFGLAVIGAAITSNWFDTWFAEVVEHVSGFNPDNPRVLIEKCLYRNITPVNTTQLFDTKSLNSCIAMYDWVDTSCRFFYPFAIEYSMLAGHCVVHWFVGCKRGCSNAAAKLVHNSAEQKSRRDCHNAIRDDEDHSTTRVRRLDSDSADTDVESSRLSSEDAGVKTHLLQSIPNQASPQQHPEIGGCFRLASLCRTMCVVVAFLSTVVLCILSFIANDRENYRWLLEILYIYDVCFIAGTIVVLVVGFVCGVPFVDDPKMEDIGAGQGRSTTTGHNGLEYLVFFSSAGSFLYSSSAIMRTAEGNDGSIVAVEEILNCVHVCLMTAFIAFAKHVRFPPIAAAAASSTTERHGPTVQDRSENTNQLVEVASCQDSDINGIGSSCTNRQVTTSNNNSEERSQPPAVIIASAAWEWRIMFFISIEILLFFVSVCGWIIDSFVTIGIPGPSESSTTEYKSTGWSVMFNIAQPIAIFYRFNSAVLILNNFLTHYEQLTG